MTNMTIDFQIYHGDWLEVLPTRAPKIVSFVFADPPYNVGKDYGVYKDKLSPEEYLHRMGLLLSISRMLATRGVGMYVSGALLPTYLQLMPTAHPVIVYKRAAGVAKQGWRQQYHVALIEGRPIVITRDLIDDIRLPGEGYYFKEKRYKNPGLTSLELTKRIINMMTKEGETVLDPFMGSGTTGEACIQLNRNFIGIEIDPDQCGIAYKRIQNAKNQLVLANS